MRIIRSIEVNSELITDGVIFTKAIKMSDIGNTIVDQLNNLHS